MASVIRGSGESTLGGALDVQGVLTYEDVTSVDSVGIITARSGIIVGTGASIFSPDTNELTLGTNNVERLRIESGGNITATSRVDVGGLTVDSNLTPTSGTSIEIFYGSTGGVIQSFDRDNSNLEPLRVRGSTWDLALDGSATFSNSVYVGGDASDLVASSKNVSYMGAGPIVSNRASSSNTAISVRLNGVDKTLLKSDGSASFSGGNFTIDSNGNLLLADGKHIYMSGYVNDNTFNVASLFVDAIKCGNLRIHDGRHTSGGSSLSNNTIIGNSARTFTTASGDGNTAVGSFAGYDMSTGHDNTLLGFRAQSAVTTGGYGTFVGVDAGKNKRYGDYCTGIGYRADYYTTTGSTNNTENYDNTTCLGYDSRPSGSNQVVAGNTSATLHYYGLSNRSDERDKIDIQDEFLGLDFIKKLKPRAYKWDYRDDYFDEVFDEVEYSDNPGEFDKVARLVPVPKDGSRSGTRLHHGLIAQEVKELIDETGVDFAGYQDSKVKNGEDVLSMNYLELIAPMIKAIQEQQVQIDSLTATIESMK